MSDARRLVLWRDAWHYAEADAWSRDPVPLLTICGREVPGNASVRPFKPTADLCAQCDAARPLWRRDVA